MLPAMSLLCDYFAADNDTTAGTTASWPRGPSTPPAAKRGLGRRKQTEPAQPLPTVPLPGIEPVVMLATLEERLTGASADQALEDNADAQVGEHRQVTVFRLRTTLVEALATADDDELRDIAGPWSKTAEFFGAADPEELGQGLVRLAALARDARTAGERLYCWCSA
jgi:hypothetical protein